MAKTKTRIAGVIINHLVSSESDPATDKTIIEGECSKVKDLPKPLKFSGTQVIDRYHEVKYPGNAGKLRIVLDSAFWFCLEDVCAILGLSKEQALEKCDSGNGVPRKFVAKGSTPIVCINKFNLDDLLPGSNIDRQVFTAWLNNAMESINNGLDRKQKNKGKAHAIDGKRGSRHASERGKKSDYQAGSGKDDQFEESADSDQSTASESEDIVAFHFDGQPVRVVTDKHGEPWFIATDIAQSLEYRMASDMTRTLDDDEKGTHIVRTPSGDQEMLVISEPGLFSAILKSRKPEAKRFKRWVTHEVLPNIRKTGSYSHESRRTPLHISFDTGGLDIRGFEIEERSETGAPGLHIKIKPSHLQGASMIKKDKVIRAIDLGYGRVKFISNVTPNGYECASFPSIVGRAGGKNLGGGFFAERNNVTIQLKGLDYEVGEDSIMTVGAYGTRTLDFRYVYSDNYQILMRGALKMMGVEVIDVLVLGAPVSNFEEASKYLKSQFIGEINLDGEKQVEIKRVVVLPQPLGGYAWYGKSNDGYAQIRKQLSLVVDPGYFTFDWMVSRGTKFDTERSGSHAAGMSALIRSVARELSIKENSGTDIDSLSIWDKIDRFFYADEPFTLKGREYDLKKHLQAARSLIDNAVDALAMRVGNANDIENVILIGGGARHYITALRERLDGHVINTVDNPGYANVQGFQFVGEEMSKEVK